jgi:hypothetical protein
MYELNNVLFVFIQNIAEAWLLDDFIFTKVRRFRNVIESSDTIILF